MRVWLEKIKDKDALGGDIEHAVRLVYIQHDAYKNPTNSTGMWNEEGKFHVGVIGTQAGAQFLPNAEFDKLLGESNRQQVVDEAKRLHGNASKEPYRPLPPLMEVAEQ